MKHYTYFQNSHTPNQLIFLNLPFSWLCTLSYTSVHTSTHVCMHTHSLHTHTIYSPREKYLAYTSHPFSNELLRAPK